MKKLLLALTGIFFFGISTAQTAQKEYVDGKVWVKFNPYAIKKVAKDDPFHLPLNKLPEINNLVGKFSITNVSKPFFQADDDAKLPYVLQINFDKSTKVDQLIEDLYAINGVEYAEKVPAMYTYTTPNDPLYSQQLPEMNQILAPTAWDIFNLNSNVPVAVVDNAVMWTHADLVQNTYTNAIEAAGTTGVDDDGNGYIDDINGYDVADNDNNAVPTYSTMWHGTHCAGSVGARNNNGVGIGSIGWNIKIIPVKCTANGPGNTSIDNGYGGIIYAVKAKARVISCSWGGTGSSQAAQDVINYAWNKGCIIVCAAGNAGSSTPHYPGAYQNSYCVAALQTTGGSAGVKASFSNYGQTGNQWVDISAPGVSIYSTLAYTGTPAYGNSDGTSMATPIVAGLCGLMLAYVPQMTQQNVINCINTTAQNIYTLSGNISPINFSTGMRLGAGLINATAAMNCATGWLNAPPVANFFSLVKNTCPNTPITFQDSSLYIYNPATWSWTFQAGTPATSTSSMPTVQWAAPGTYSVGMTLSTPNGSNSITKISYITVSNPISLPLNEGFQTLPFLPANWTPVNIGNDNVYWSRSTAAGGFGTSTASALFDNAGLDAAGDRDEMRTPKYNCSNVVSAKLRFDVAYKVLNNIESDTLRVNGSTNCGASWSNLYIKGGTVLATAPLTPTAYPLWIPTSTQWRTDSINVTGLVAGQSNVMFNFVNHGHYGQGIYLDNINLFFPAPTTTFAVPPPVCAGTPVTYTNNSVGAGSYLWTFQGGSPATSTLVNPTVTYSAGGVFNATLAAYNGTTATILTKTISINGIPTVAVNNQTICAGGTATLNATGAQTYTWSTGFVGNPLLVAPGGNTVYSVIGNSMSCLSSSTTVSVTIGSQLSVFITPSTPTVCASGTSTLTASGAVNYTWSTGSNATAIVVTPTTNTTYSIIGSNGACTGTTIMTMTVIPTPSINLNITPSSSICAGDTATLGASGSYTSFTWVTPTIVANSITVSPSSNTTYTVYGAGTGGCNTSSIVNVTVKPLPMGVVTTTDATCGGCPDGEAVITVTSGVSPYTYQWLPVGGTQSFVSGFAPDCYSVNVTSANGCANLHTLCIGFNTGLQNGNINTFKGLNIFPNPANNIVMIDFNGNIFDVKLYNTIGQLIYDRKNNSHFAMIQLEELAKGVYTIQIEAGSEIVRKKLIIQ
ncbi:MAG: S8 family serine peptidase [Sphingobacteriaceae bacterium]|nr:S8 family serine peptidase [Sphingobacteriaceae bacterium]